MLFMVQMQVNLPVDMPAERADKLKADENPGAAVAARRQVEEPVARGRPLRQRQHLRRESNDELHTLLASLPLFPYMDIQVTALARHPSAI